MSATPDFRIDRNGLFYDVVSAASGRVVVELVDTHANAQLWALRHRADLDRRPVPQPVSAAVMTADDRAEVRALDRLYAAIDAMRDGTGAMDRAVDRVRWLIDADGRSDCGMCARAA